MGRDMIHKTQQALKSSYLAIFLFVLLVFYIFVVLEAAVLVEQEYQLFRRGLEGVCKSTSGNQKPNTLHSSLLRTHSVTGETVTGASETCVALVKGFSVMHDMIMTGVRPRCSGSWNSQRQEQCTITCWLTDGYRSGLYPNGGMSALVQRMRDTSLLEQGLRLFEEDAEDIEHMPQSTPKSWIRN